MKINKTTIRFILAMVGLAFSIAWFILLLFIDAPEANRDMISAVTGAIIAICLKEVFGYYYGSSQGSDDKTDMMGGAVS